MQKTANLDISPLHRAILHTVVYADIFDYPLTEIEIGRYLTGVRASHEVVSELLKESGLTPALLRREGKYYFLSGRSEIIATRQRREQIAPVLWREAVRYGRIIARLPFVRMVAVTGSLAMNNVEAGADLDYLIVTKANRLWLCRALTLALGRLAAWRGVSLCPNYLISENSLAFSQQTLYAAHELTQMVPLSGLDVYQRIRTANPWVKRFLPNADGAPPQTADVTGAESRSITQSWLEAALLTAPGSWIENWEMDRKIRRLRRENDGNPEANFSADLCKGHSHQHGQKTEQILRERLEHLSLGMESAQRNSAGLSR